MAFNILLAGVPFLLLLASGLSFLLPESVASSTEVLRGVLDRVLPTHRGVENSILEPIFVDMVRTRTAFGIGGAIGFVIFSARLFTSLRAVMKMVFSHSKDRTFLGGLLWDLYLVITSGVLMTAWVALTAWLAVSSGSVGGALTEMGERPQVLSGFEYWSGRLLAMAVVVAIFVSLYRWLPKRRTPWIPSIAGGVAAALLFELARWLFAVSIRAFPPSSVFTGTLGALVIVVFWTYYAALIFVLGAETASATQAQLAPAEQLAPDDQLAPAEQP